MYLVTGRVYKSSFDFCCSLNSVPNYVKGGPFDHL